jgi:hypothetical protein
MDRRAQKGHASHSPINGSTTPKQFQTAQKHSNENPMLAIGQKQPSVISRTPNAGATRAHAGQKKILLDHKIGSNQLNIGTGLKIRIKSNIQRRVATENQSMKSGSHSDPESAFYHQQGVKQYTSNAPLNQPRPAAYQTNHVRRGSERLAGKLGSPKDYHVPKPEHHKNGLSGPSAFDAQ